MRFAASATIITSVCIVPWIHVCIVPDRERFCPLSIIN